MPHIISPDTRRRRGTAPEAGAVGPARPRSREASTSRICLDRPPPAPDFHQRAGDGPDHVAEKSVAGDLVHDQISTTEDTRDTEERTGLFLCVLRVLSDGEFVVRVTRDRVTVRSVVRVVPPAAANAAKSCRPSSDRAAASIASTSSGSDHVPRVVTLEWADDSRRCRSDSGRSSCRRSSARGTLRRPRPPTAPGCRREAAH